MKGNKLFLVIFIMSLFFIVAFAFCYHLYINQKPQSDSIPTVEQSSSRSSSIFRLLGLTTDTSRSSIDLDKIANGGPGKDGIPSIDDPTFVEISEAKDYVDGSTRGIFFEHNSKKRFYPYNILVWHEIVNDKIDDLNFAVTFCPLCGSAVVFDREFNGKVYQFGVSGLLYESNVLMYDRKTESLWSQVEAKAVVGDLTGQELERVDFDLITFEQLQINHPESSVLSDDTGFDRDYSTYPYGDYDKNETLYFSVTYQDKRLPLKEMVYAVNIDGQAIAFVLESLIEEGSAAVVINGGTVEADYNDDEIEIVFNDKTYPGFYSQWFSWANHNLPKGVNPDADGIVCVLD